MKFYGTVKLHKLKNNNSLNDLPLRLIISNVGSASYQLTNFMAKLRSPLSTSQYTLNNTKKFIEMIKNQSISSAYKMICFDKSYLFTMILLDYTFNRILKRVPLGFINRNFSIRVHTAYIISL